MAAVKPRKAPDDGTKEHKHRVAATTRRSHGAIAGQPPRRKETEERAAFALFDQAQKLDEVASSTQESNTRDTVRAVVSDLLSRADPIRVATASRILDLDAKTVRAWVKMGVLTPAPSKPRLMLEAGRLYAVATLVHDLRQAGRSRSLLDAVWNRLQDAEFMESDELAEGLLQMRQGQGRPWRQIKAEWSTKRPELPLDED